MNGRVQAVPEIGRYYRLVAVLAFAMLLTAIVPGQIFVLPAPLFLPLHALLETAAIVTAMLVFAVTWHGFAPARPAASLWLACALFASAWLDFAHILSYQGMPDFVTPSGPEKAIAFWLASSLAVAATLCAVTFMPRDGQNGDGRRGRIPILAGYAAFVVAVVWLVLGHQDALPRTFVPGQGQTPFKYAMEWLAIALLAVAAWRFRRLAAITPAYDAAALFAAAVVSILSELAFTQYLSVYDGFNLLGHVFKIVAYGLIYQAVFVANVRMPYRALKTRGDELAAAHERFRDLVETSPDWIWEIDADGVYTYASPRVKSMLGYAPEEMLGRTPFDFMMPGEARRLRPALEAITRMHLPFLGLENVNLCKDGREVVLETSGVPIFDGLGEFLGYRGSDRDITERVRGEEALEAERVHMRTLVNTIPDLVWLKGPDGIYLACNPTFERLFGAKEADILGKTDYDFVDRGLADSFRENDRRAIAAGGPRINEEWVIFADDGHRALLHTIKAPMYDGMGKLVGVLGIARDITALREAEYALRKSEENLNLAQAVAHIGSWNLDVRANVLSWTGENYRLFGIPSGTPLTYEDFLDCVHPDDREFVDREWKAALQGQPYDIEHRLLVNGEVRWVREKAELLFEPNGELIGGIGIAQDLTERKRADAERDKLERQLRQAQKMEALGQLTGGVAHDFNNILASIMGYSNLALTRLVPDKESKLAQYLGRVLTASERARDLIAKMMAYSRTQSTGQIGDLLPAPVVKEVSHMLAATIPSTIELALFVDDRTPAIRVDAGDLQQILVNLAINARDAIGEVGRIEIGLGPSTEVGGICALCQETVMGEFVALEVIDSGDGIAPENLGRIFDPFFTTKEVGKGTGLGLSMVQGIVKKSGGHVLIHSRPGQGTVFRILFPLAGAVADVPDPTARKLSPAEAKRIWVVDDEPTVAGYFDELLASHDYRVRTFDNPVEALRAFRENPEAVDLLIIDQTLPGMCGSDLAQAMLKTRSDLPIYLCTDSSEHMDAQRADELGIRHCCQKPVDGGKLLAALAEEFAKTPRGT